MTDFVDLIVEVHEALEGAGLPHAFGGALALGYVATPRGTVDIDVNVFVPGDELPRIAGAVRSVGFQAGGSDPGAAAFGGVRFLHAVEPFPLDVFPSLDERYDEVARRTVRHRFGPRGVELPFLGAEDLVVFKLSFGRPQDWVDLQSIAAARPHLDLAYVEAQLLALRGPTMHPRLARFRQRMG